MKKGRKEGRHCLPLRGFHYLKRLGASDSRSRNAHGTAASNQGEKMKQAQLRVLLFECRARSQKFPFLLLFPLFGPPPITTEFPEKLETSLSRTAEQRDRGRVKEEKCFNSSEWAAKPARVPLFFTSAIARDLARAEKVATPRRETSAHQGMARKRGEAEGERKKMRLRDGTMDGSSGRLKCAATKERERAVGGMVGVKIKIADRKRGYGPPRRSSTRLEATGNGPCNLKAAARN